MYKDPKTRLTKMYDRPGFLLRRAYQISAGVFEQECRELSLTPAQFAVLSVLAATPDIDQARLSRCLGFDKVTVMYILRGLVDRGLITRDTGTGKGRRIALALTKAGALLLEQAQEPTEVASATLMACFSETQQKQFIKLLKILTTSLEDRARAPLIMPEFVEGERVEE
ncbi:transcriptional regulator, MarR family [Paraburkholderia caribensis MBA4]|uniref:Transcriptional regulator, MarR family n=1 Tax=Paraburkholderia caribensis MBA4 TaxID=1323664 RepID=A0A0P0RIM9_9BURK|nr:MarR family transcriptional regulator [Paraburkholderia caribensis]ALL68480.1 transcriptional regulator, MarR family [Paraburkholderia caribensis MBA4]